MNCKLVIQYDGCKYFGSQKQPDKVTVESTLQKALKLLNIDSKIIFSGRTDKGVHATGQVININIPEYWKDFIKLKNKLNDILPKSINIRSITQVSEDFHSRFSAKRRSYRYIVSTKPSNPFYDDYITFIDSLDEKKINEAIAYFIGRYDYKNFSKEGSDPNSTIRDVYEAKLYKYKGYYIFKFSSNGFLRSQIRLMVGFLLAISEGKKTIEDLKEHLNEKNPKNRFKKPAPSNGLYLSNVIYH